MIFPRDAEAFARAAERYWPGRAEEVADLLDRGDRTPIEVGPLPPRFRWVDMPAWTAPGTVDGRILVPDHLAADGVWTSIDWVSVGLWYLDCLAERVHESNAGPIHSYSIRLRGWDERQWQRAWVNRIAIAIRAMLARDAQREPDAWFGPLPRPEFDLSHDLDALTKHLSLRLKQTAFSGFNGVRGLLRGRPDRFVKGGGRALRFFLGGGDYDLLDEVLDSESAAGVTSVFHVFPGRPRKRLFDPKYEPGSPGVAARLRMIAARGCEIGLHPGFDDFEDQDSLARGAEKLAGILGRKPVRIRQHWLRFTFAGTWRAQEAAGFQVDSTLGFNDRPALRAGAALRYAPLVGDRRSESLEEIPLVLMDSHLHDYLDLDGGEIFAEADRWIDEIISVGGIASVNWHQRVLHPDYGWGASWRHVLERVRVQNR